MPLCVCLCVGGVNQCRLLFLQSQSGHCSIVFTFSASHLPAVCSSGLWPGTSHATHPPGRVEGTQLKELACVMNPQSCVGQPRLGTPTKRVSAPFTFWYLWHIPLSARSLWTKSQQNRHLAVPCVLSRPVVEKVSKLQPSQSAECLNVPETLPDLFCEMPEPLTSCGTTELVTKT